VGWALQSYIVAAHLAAPFWGLSVRRRSTRGKEDPARISERFGHASARRPEGPLLWVHALGIGEAAAMLAVIRAVREARPDVAVLLTTNTRTGADGLAKIGLSEGVIHQYSPVDAPGPVRRFLGHWRPDAVLVAELDLWPLILSRLHSGGVSVVMANARLSDHRFQSRLRIRALMRDVLAMIEEKLVQDAQTARRLVALGAEPATVRVAGLLKAAAAPLPDGDTRLALRAAIGVRPVWLAASTQAREIPALVAAHASLRRALPDAMLILAPRQPAEADDAHKALVAAFGPVARHGLGQLPGATDSAWLADTMGEMGMIYRLAPVAFIGHSLPVQGRPLTGKNPFEAASLGVAVIHGPCIGNFAESYEALGNAAAAVQVADGPGLAQALAELLADPARQAAMTRAAADVLEQARAALPMTVDAILGRLPPAGPA
jgi:3-deoxy-D-manno-octulosonic-acid transferase